MRALDTGGIPAVHDLRHDKAMREAVRGDYDPNPHGYYEAVDRRRRRADWTTFRGRALKCFHGEMNCLRDGFAYRAVYLWRDPSEIEASHRDIGLKTDFTFLQHYDLDVRNDVAWLRGRGVKVTLLRYPEIIASPERALASLHWPIMVAAAAAMVEPALYRHRGAS